MIALIYVCPIDANGINPYDARIILEAEVE
jgi:hypothetical protein